MDPLGNPLTTHPIQTGWEISIELCLNWRFRCIDNPDRQFVNGYVPTRTQTRSDDAEPFLTLPVEDGDSSIEGLLTSVQTFEPWPILQDAGMVIVKERHPSQMRPLHDWSYWRKPLLSGRITSIVPIRAIQDAVHHLLLTPQPDSTQSYLSNTIDWNAFSLFYI